MLRRAYAAAGAAAALLVALTVVRYGVTANGLAWSAVQVVLVAIAVVDLRERRIPNAVVLPLGLAAIVARLAFERGALVEILVAGAAAFAVFILLALAVRGGLGMGDVKLAGVEGLLLGRVVVDALLLGVVLGGIAALALLAVRRASRTSTYAYGPYLALGAAVALIVWGPPALL